jgi:ABC-2 type transport system ATP-binding protein
MSSVAAVEVIDVSKRFRLYHEKSSSLKERFVHPRRMTYEDLWALDGVSFEVPEGDTFGILGRNGSGKSTLLKCVSGILQVTSGKVLVRGKLAALLELGAGFQPELSGRDNVFLNASLLGLSTREVERRFDEIVAFAELEQFIDNQVKYYSSGMYVRLGFAVAVNVDPDVLVVDEVLAVGDEQFQRKCLERIKLFQKEGRTILFVTHAADMVRQICEKAVVLKHGKLLGIGPPGEAIRLFRENLVEEGEGAEQPEEVVVDDASRIRTHTGESATPIRPVVVTGAEVQHPGIGKRLYLMPREPLRLWIAYEAAVAVPDVVFAIQLHDMAGNLVYGTDTEILDYRYDMPPGRGVASFAFDSVPLLDGTYRVNVGIRSKGGGTVYDWREQLCQFEVMNPGRSVGIVALDPQVEIHPL